MAARNNPDREKETMPARPILRSGSQRIADMHHRFPAIVIGALIVAPLSGQSIVTFHIDQPPMFVVDAGPDQPFTGVPELGGSPTATGGGGAFAYAWAPPEFLDDPTAANPRVIQLAATTVFTVTVRDLSTACEKTDTVTVLVEPDTGLGGDVYGDIRYGPNPAGSALWVEGPRPMVGFELRSLSGAVVSRGSFPASTRVVLDLSSVVEGMYVMTVSLADGGSIIRKLCKTTSDH